MSIADARHATKTDNHKRAFPAKVQIRQNVLAAIDKASVFDAFAGAGEMYGAVWKGAASYTGCDLKWMRDGRTMFAGDNRRVLRAIDLKPFNVFDLDAYGSPWEQVIIIADRRPVAAGEVVGLIVTNGDGRALTLRANLPLPHAIRQLAGLRGTVAGLRNQQDEVENRIVAGLAKRMRCDVIKRWQADGKTGAKVRYIGLVLRGR